VAIGPGLLGRGFNRNRLGIVEIEALDPDLILEAGDVFRLSRGGEHAPTMDGEDPKRSAGQQP